MKKAVLLGWMMAVLPWAAWAQSPGDDIYYVPKKQKEQKKTESMEAKSAGEVLNSTRLSGTGSGVVVVRDHTGRTRDIDEYNRREYVAGKNDFSIKNDTLYIDEHADSDLPGHWVNEFEGSQDDYEYAVRLIRFRDPAYAIPVSSPLYWDVVYGTALFSTWDWNVYDDGFYAYVFPTYTNRLWWDWRFDSWRHWGWHNGYWGGPHYAWGGYWGDPYWGWHHHHHFPHHPSFVPSHPIGQVRRNPNYAHRGNTSRPRNVSRTRPTVDRGSYARPTINRNNGTSTRPTTTRRVVRPSVNTNNVRGNSSYTRPSVTRPRSMDYTRPSSTRTRDYDRPTPTRNERPSVERSSRQRPTVSPNRSSGGGNHRPSVGGGGSRGRR